MFFTCPLCMYALGSWSSCEKCTIIDEYNEKYKLCNPCKLHRRYSVQIKGCNSCLEEICDSHPIGQLCSNCHYDKYDQWEKTYPCTIGKNPKRDFSLFLRDWYRRGFKLFWKEESGLRFNCWGNKTIWFLRHRYDNTAYYDYKPSDIYLLVTECDSSLENTVCDIVSIIQIETREFHNMNANRIIDYTMIYDNSEVKLYGRKCDPDFVANPDQYTVNSNDLPVLVILDSCLYTEEEEEI